MSSDADPSRLTDRLGTRWATIETSYKWHASCRHSHPAADALLALLARDQIGHDDIAAVTARVHQGALDVLGRVIDPQNVHQAKFSMGTVLGLIAVHGHAGLDEFETHAFGDPRVAAFVRASTMVLDPEVDAAYPAPLDRQSRGDDDTTAERSRRASTCRRAIRETRLSRAEIADKGVRLARYRDARDGSAGARRDRSHLAARSGAACGAHRRANRVSLFDAEASALSRRRRCAVAGRFSAARIRSARCCRSEAELCAQFGLSRQTIREAIRLLVELGLASRRQGVGTRVERRDVTQTYVQRFEQVSDIWQYVEETSRKVLKVADVPASRAPAPVAGRSRSTLANARGTTVRGRRAQPDRVDAGLRRAGIRRGDRREESRSRADLLADRAAIRREGESHSPGHLRDLRSAPRSPRCLRVPARSVGLSVAREYVSTAGEVFEVTISVHPADRYHYSMQLDLAYASDSAFTAERLTLPAGLRGSSSKK